METLEWRLNCLVYPLILLKNIFFCNIKFIVSSFYGKLIIGVLFLVNLPLYIYASQWEDRLNFQRVSFENRFANASIRFYESGEIESVSNLNLKIDSRKEIDEFIERYNYLFGLSGDDCIAKFSREIKGGELSILEYKKICQGIEVFPNKLSLFLNKENIFGIRSNLRNFDISDREFKKGEYEVSRNLKTNYLLTDIKSIRRIFYDLGTKIIPVYLVNGYEKVFLKSYYYFVDAKSGELLFKIPLLKRAKGNVYLDSPEKDKKVTLVDLPNPIENGILKNEIVDVYSDCDPTTSCGDSSRLAKGDINGNFIYQPNESSSKDAFAEVMAYYHLNRLYNWFVESKFEFQPFDIKAVVNFFGVGSEYDEMFQCNAFYLERQVVIGFCPSKNPYNLSGQNINVAYDADVIMHELVHGFYEEIYSLYPTIDSMGYSGMIYGIGEAVADFIPSHITNDQYIGRHLGKIIKSEHIRNLGVLRSCPEYLDGESHNDGEIISTALWAARNLLSNRELFSKTVFLSIGGLNSSSSFKDFYENLLEFISQSMNKSDAEIIKKPFLDRNIDRCGRFIEVANGYTAKGYLLPSIELGISGEVPFEVQYVYTLPEDNAIVNVDISVIKYLGNSSGDYVKFYVNHNRPISYSFESIKTDYVWTKGAHTITNLKSGKYYILPVGDGQGLYLFKVRFAYKEPAPVVESVEPNEIKINSSVDELIIKGQNFHKDARIKLPYGITYEDYEVIDSTSIYVYNLKISNETQCGYNSVSVTNPDGQRGVGKSLLLIIKGNEKCKCDFSYDCDEGCKCDPDCSDGGCGCSIIY